MTRTRFGIFGLLAALGTCATAAAQQYPSQPIRAVVGYAAGGGADGMIRAISNELSEALGQPVVIDNRPGGGTVIATKIVADAKPDGYTIYVADPAIYFHPFMLNAATNKVLQIPAVRARFTDTGSEVLPGTPEDYGRIIRAELDKWGKVIRAAGIKFD
jgi:tripartite-type tricarboxylate transporter receptor subunit TctC